MNDYWKLVNLLHHDYGSYIYTYERNLPQGVLILVISTYGSSVAQTLQYLPQYPALDSSGPFR